MATTLLESGTKGPRALRVLIGGASGLVGSALQRSLSLPKISNNFHPEVFSLVRRPPESDREIFWDPNEGRIDIDRLEGFDAIVNLAGENAGSGEGLLAFTGRWTDRKKHWIMESRRRGNLLLAQASAALVEPPKVLIAASGVGYYGSNLDGTKEITEDDPKGTGFLSEVADVSESALDPAREAGIRTVAYRIGVVLSQHGGVIEKMHLPFSLGVGGRLGSGTQYMSWVSLEDVIRAIEHAIRRTELDGTYNLCAPNPATNAEFTSAMGTVLRRPTLFPVPEVVLKTVMGEFAEDAMLASQRVVPRDLLAAGFRFKHNNIVDGVRAAYAE